jgi:hypothetical protein
VTSRLIKNTVKFDELLSFHRRAADAYRAEADEWQRSKHPEAATEGRAAHAFAKEHDKLISKLVEAAKSKPWKLVELTKDTTLTPGHLQLTEEDVFGEDE